MEEGLVAAHHALGPTQDDLTECTDGEHTHDP